MCSTGVTVHSGGEKVNGGHQNAMSAHEFGKKDENYSIADFSSDGGVSVRTGTSSIKSGTSTKTDVIQEVRNDASKENLNVNLWRIALVTVLLCVGVAVTLTTFRFLREDEVQSFETAVCGPYSSPAAALFFSLLLLIVTLKYEQFSRTVGDAAVKQQKDIRDALRGLENAVTSYALSTNKTWPFVTLPRYESYAKHFFIQSNTEAVSLFPLVRKEETELWNEYVDSKYVEIAEESHILRYGNLDKLKPVGYKPFISAPDIVNGGFKPDEEREMYLPSWHYSPPPFTYGFTNWNAASVPDYGNAMQGAILLRNETMVTRVRKFVGEGVVFTKEEHEALHSKLRESDTEHPHSFLWHPIRQRSDDDDSPVIGILGTPMAWDFSLQNLLPEAVVGLYAVIKNDCNQTYTYEIDGSEAFFLGEMDLHEPEYDEYERVVNLTPHTHPNYTTTPGHCQYTMHIYPGKKFQDIYSSFVPVTYAIVVASTFLLVAIVFFIYNFFVNQRNEKLVYNAARSNAVISALFPKSIRDRIMEDEEEALIKKKSRTFKSVLSGSDTTTNLVSTNAKPTRPPLADYFPETTILFADVSGFTAWASVREPPQVFTLLETLYGAFDIIAKRSKVFKVETVGDCYVAATGIPEFHKEHSVHMVQFARKILVEMIVLTQELEITLGPDTGDLSLRIGIHSGPVTGGVLRGERARFQLFGDTINTASRIENTGEQGRIHISHETAESLKNCGKGNWLVKRDEPVKIKGKGDIQTYWIEVKKDYTMNKSDGAGHMHNTSEGSESSGDSADSSFRMKKLFIDNSTDAVAAREARLVDWNVQIFKDLLKQIFARRIVVNGLSQTRNGIHETSSHSSGATSLIMNEDYTPLEEVREIIRLPEFDSKVAKFQKNHQFVHLPDKVEQQLHEYVASIAKRYRANDFHNFEHASHVTMSVIKLLSRIVAPTNLDENLDFSPNSNLRAQLHDHTYGITSDPLTQFACAFSALIHDVDHVGVPNAQLVKEKADIAIRYKDRSVAEQNSVVIAWNLLMESKFNELRNCLCGTPEELRRFRNLVVNGVMATDITDKDLKNLRNARWEKAFKEPSMIDGNDQMYEEDVRDVIHRKATIVIEHLIQASDVAHTMQHWHVYRKWNERFFRECYAAYMEGRAEKDPSEGWYQGEIGFFDFYIIPLAKKLDTCGVFGKSSDEYLNYAMQNREEWKSRGEEVVAEMLEAVRKEYPDY